MKNIFLGIRLPVWRGLREKTSRRGKMVKESVAHLLHGRRACCCFLKVNTHHGVAAHQWVGRERRIESPNILAWPVSKPPHHRDTTLALSEQGGGLYFRRPTLPINLSECAWGSDLRRRLT